MSPKWLAVILMWVAGASAMVGTAVAWGASGRGTVLSLGTVLAVALVVSTGVIANTENYEAAGKDNDG